MKFLFLFITIVITSTSFSQMKIEANKTITNGAPIFLKYVNATITPPKGYIFLEEYSSFLDEASHTSISVVRDTLIPYQSMINDLLKRNYERSKVKLLEKKEMENGYFFIYLFQINNQPVERILYVTGNEKESIYSMANYKQIEKDKYYRTLLSAILSIKY